MHMHKQLVLALFHNGSLNIKVKECKRTQFLACSDNITRSGDDTVHVDDGSFLCSSDSRYHQVMINAF